MCAKSSALSGLTDFCLEGMDSSTPYEGSLPPMRMYFHNGWSEIMWFRGWVPKTERDYWLAVAVVVLMGRLLIERAFVSERAI